MHRNIFTSLAQLYVTAVMNKSWCQSMDIIIDDAHNDIKLQLISVCTIFDCMSTTYYTVVSDNRGCDLI